MDVLDELEVLAIATRLKRLSERLSKDVTTLYRELNFDFEARWFTFIYALKLKSPLSVTELAQCLSISHTAVNTLAEELYEKGYVIAGRNKKDERQRLIKITAKGKNLLKALQPVLENISKAIKDMLPEIQPDFINSIRKFEKKLDERSLYDRIYILMNGSLPNDISILDYNPGLKKYFKLLNYEWLEEYFEVEEKDRILLSNPKNKIINKGGFILFAKIDDSIVGTCAVIKHKNGLFELAKMAVTKKYRGRGIGSKLIKEVSYRMQKADIHEIYLLTNSKLKAANVLYKRFGFVKIKENPLGNSGYIRKIYTMRLKLD